MHANEPKPVGGVIRVLEDDLKPLEQTRSIPPEVCRVLQARRLELHEAYAKALRSEAGPHYAGRPEEELRETTRNALAAYLAILCAGDWGPMEHFVEEIAGRRFPQQFPLSEVQTAFAAFRSLCVPILTDSFHGETLDDALALLGGTVDRTINLFSDTYQRLHLEEIRRTSAELAEANRRLQCQYEEVAEAVKIKGQFFANMSHELRSPMNSIIGYTELLLDGIDGPVTDEQMGSLRKILASAHYLLKLINDILDLSKIEAGCMETQPRPFDPRTIVREAMDTVKPLAYRKRIELREEAEGSVGPFTADADKIKQVLINLLSNAVKFTDEGEVMCAVQASPGSLRIEVRDSGIGIAPEDRERIFHKFFQVDSSHRREHKGTGVGLHLSRMLVELMGGEIRVESEVGKGSVFSFAVPEATVAKPGCPEPAGTDGAPRILVIEDDPSALELIRKILDAEAMEMIPAADGAEGIDLARKRKPSAITLDLLLPKLDGMEVLERLKADPQTRDIPVMIVSCLDRREQGLRRGADAYTVKPIDRERFVAQLRSLLPRKEGG